MKILAVYLPDWGRYFLCRKIVTTRVITAQSIITKVKRSLYETRI